jgi:hypothetical protein
VTKIEQQKCSKNRNTLHRNEIDMNQWHSILIQKPNWESRNWRFEIKIQRWGPELEIWACTNRRTSLKIVKSLVGFLHRTVVFLWIVNGAFHQQQDAPMTKVMWLTVGKASHGIGSSPGHDISA